ncbi:hypothetical protein BT67DRAFT_119333 [Trichocladium antarcticum]|uniref:Uncharacterized protein n=1 Tax=Trichocladium antarcticum TaxID=1450529 RepID=A0AAN6ZH66_9PEZI|nr:hypothetical protein BT67DRAFT_119333 [Trichocladium antarcticum]
MPSQRSPCPLAVTSHQAQASQSQPTWSLIQLQEPRCRRSTCREAVIPKIRGDAPISSGAAKISALRPVMPVRHRSSPGNSHPQQYCRNDVRPVTCRSAPGSSRWWSMSASCS